MAEIRNPFPYAPASQDDEVKSPCINVCRMNPRTGYCEGCLRSIDEIAGWSQFSADEKRAVLARLPSRRGEA
ncbi:MAG: hypothetical protein H6R20_1326 [Proteobacteria bacterium]|jgi:predicted Fe-S protein YdhL (DUF1289 family)|nr:hypothetical protein [Pseudomonadota bacterium]